MPCFVMFVTAVCVLFLSRGEWNNCVIRLDDMDNSVRWKQRMVGKGGKIVALRSLFQLNDWRLTVWKAKECFILKYSFHVVRILKRHKNDSRKGCGMIWSNNVKTLLKFKQFTALFNIMRTLKFKGRPTNGFSLPSIKCSAVPPSLRLLPSTVSLSEPVHNDLITARSRVVGSWKEPPNTVWLTVAKHAYVGRALNFRVYMLLKGAVRKNPIENRASSGFWKKSCIRIILGISLVFFRFS